VLHVSVAEQLAHAFIRHGSLDVEFGALSNTLAEEDVTTTSSHRSRAN
jgi:hypothetical protein